MYKIDTDESKDQLLNKIKQYVKNRKINFDSNRPWQGFLTDGTNVIFQTLDDYYLTKYGFEVKSVVTLFNQESYVNYLQEEVPVIFDVEKGYVVINSSSTSHRAVVEKSMEVHLEDAQYIKLNRIKYSPDFLKWLVNNASDNSEMIVKINSTKLDKLIDYDENTTDVAIGSDDQVKDSGVYREVEDEGRHVNIRGFFRINGNVVIGRIYSKGQITMVADYPQYGRFVIELANELERLRIISGIS